MLMIAFKNTLSGSLIELGPYKSIDYSPIGTFIAYGGVAGGNRRDWIESVSVAGTRCKFLDTMRLYTGESNRWDHVSIREVEDTGYEPRSSTGMISFDEWDKMNKHD